MSQYRLTPEMEGERPFRCFRCHKQLVWHIEGACTLKFQCPRCKARITVELDVIPSALALKGGVCVHP